MTDDFGPEPHETVEQAADTLKDVKEELSKERAQESQNRRWINQIGLSTGILSALAAITSMQAGYLANEGMLAQIAPLTSGLYIRQEALSVTWMNQP